MNKNHIYLHVSMGQFMQATGMVSS